MNARERSKTVAGGRPKAAAASGPASGGVRFGGLVADLQSDDVATRRDAAVLLSNLGLESAIRPLLRAYMSFGDEWLCEALGHYGSDVIEPVEREASEPAVGALALSRLMRVLGETGDPRAARLARAYADYPDTRVHAEACTALARLGDERGYIKLGKDLVSRDYVRRLAALEAVRSLDTPRAGALRAAHLERYLGGSGAVPAAIAVHAPFLIDREDDLAATLAGLLDELEEDLVLAVGPASGAVAERRRTVIEAAARGWRVWFTTPRHSVDEHLAALCAARDEARRNPRVSGGAPVLVVGPLPVPSGDPPSWHYLTWLPDDRYRVRVVNLGASEYSTVMDWWRYVSEVAEVPCALDVVVDLLTLDAQHMTGEERLLHLDLEPGDRERFARAMLARL
jgi:hypothetical protein